MRAPGARKRANAPGSRSVSCPLLFKGCRQTCLLKQHIQFSNGVIIAQHLFLMQLKFEYIMRQFRVNNEIDTYSPEGYIEIKVKASSCSTRRDLLKCIQNSYSPSRR